VAGYAAATDVSGIDEVRSRTRSGGNQRVNQELSK
jgi:hypothetical protein